MKVKQADNWSPRSAGSLARESGLRGTLSDYIRLKDETEKTLAGLEAEKRRDLEHITEGDKRAEEFLSATLSKITKAKEKLAVYVEAIGASKIKLEQFLQGVSKERSARREHQAKLAALALELPKKAREIDRQLNAIRQLLGQCVDLVGQMEALGKSIDLDYYWDRRPFSALLESLPVGILSEVERRVSGLLGKRDGTKPYVVIEAKLDLRENLKDAGIHYFGDVVWVDAEEAGELLREDRYHTKRTAFGNEQKLLPPSIMAPDEFAKVKTQAAAEGWEISDILERRHQERIYEKTHPKRGEPLFTVSTPMALSKTEIGG